MKPIASISANVEMIDVGIASAAMNVVRKFQRNRNTTIAARIEPTIKMLLDRVQRVLDKDRVVADDPHLIALRQRRLDLLEPRL